MTERQKRQITARIKAAIEGSELTRYEISKRSGVNQSVLSRFVNGKGSLSLDAIEALAPVLGLTITTTKKK